MEVSLIGRDRRVLRRSDFPEFPTISDKFKRPITLDQLQMRVVSPFDFCSDFDIYRYGLAQNRTCRTRQHDVDVTLWTHRIGKS